MIRKISVAIALAALSGCASVSKTYAPDGRQAFALDCSGLARSWAMCQKKAGDICRERGYDVFTRDSETGSLVSANQQQLFGGSVMNRNMLIACKQGPAPSQ